MRTLNRHYAGSSTRRGTNYFDPPPAPRLGIEIRPYLAVTVRRALVLGKSLATWHKKAEHPGGGPPSDLSRLLEARSRIDLRHPLAVHKK